MPVDNERKHGGVAVRRFMAMGYQRRGKEELTN
jgi:hypothetical protein